MKRIVVGFDGGEEARDALHLGDRVARLEGAKLIVVAAGLFEPQISTEPERIDSHDRLRDLFAQVGEELGARRIEPRIVEGLPAARGLISIADEEDADLIVVGSTQRGRIGRVLPGSVGAQLLHGSHCPVAIAPKGFREARKTVHGVIGVAYDGSPEAELALAEAAHMARVLEAELRLITVTPEVEEPQALLERGLAAVPDDVEAESLLLDGDPGQAIVGSSDEIDVLVIGSRGRGPLKRTLLGGVSAHVCARCECPVVVVPRGAHPGTEAATALVTGEALG